MKLHHIFQTALVAAVLLCQANAQAPATTGAPPPGLIPPGPSARDGCTRSGTDVLYTRRGITAPVKQEIRLPNGTSVLPDGTIKHADGTHTSLRANELLTLDGQLAETTLSPNGTAPVSPTVPGRVSERTTGAIRDGFTMAGGKVLVTRHGATEPLTSELRFENGMRLQPNGSLTLPNGSESSLKPTQVITLKGELIDVDRTR